MKTLISNVRQAIISKGFLISLIGVAVVIFAASFEQIVSAFRADGLLWSGFHHYMIMDALASDAMTLVLPIAAALPFTASFIDDIKSGYIKAYLHRTSANRYIFGKCAACALSGGLATALGIAAAYIISCMVFLPTEAAPETSAETAGFFGELMEKLLLFFLSGAFWACVGMLFAALTGSKYMAYASPFIMYYVLIIICERYFTSLYVLYPKEWTAPSASWMWGTGGVVIMLVELTVIVSAVFSIAAKRRLARL